MRLLVTKILDCSKCKTYGVSLDGKNCIRLVNGKRCGGKITITKSKAIKQLETVGKKVLQAKKVLNEVDLFDKIVLLSTGLKVIKEYRFHPKRKWRFDYCIPEHKISVEVEGGIWSDDGGGRHNRGVGFINDMEKYNTATTMGWRIIRILPGDYGKAIRYIEEIIKNEKS